jgi:hypothetical protein
LFRWHVRYEEVHGGRRHAANHRFPRRSLAHLARRCLTPSIPRSRRTTGEVLTLLSDDACDAFLDCARVRPSPRPSPDVNRTGSIRYGANISASPASTFGCVRPSSRPSLRTSRVLSTVRN